MNSILFGGGHLTQENRFIRIESGLGDEVLMLTKFQGTEGLSSLFNFEIHMLSYRGDIKPNEIVGDHVSVSIDPYSEQPRFFNGFVSTFEYTGLIGRDLYGYRAEIVPWLWFFKQRINFRVFQHQTVPEILEFLFSELGFSDYKLSLAEQYPKVEYCVQFGETDFDFMCRLLEKEGIFYYFTHEAAIHTLHLIDSISAFSPQKSKEIKHSSGSRSMNYIHTWQHKYQYFPAKWSQNDFNYEASSNSLITETSSFINLKNNQKFSVYEYPGEYKDKERGAKLAKLRMEEIETAYDVISAKSNILDLEAAKKFKLLSDENLEDGNKTFVITQLFHQASDDSYLQQDKGGSNYQNNFYCIPDKTPFRPQRSTPKPRIDGVQTATVVGRSGEEIFTDEYGRIKIQFHWDMYGNKDENSSCWVRVATQWAGSKWGTIGIPRVGQEVVVTFINGDPDQPLVIGSVYNSSHMPPYPLPDKKTISGVKSRSTKGGDPGTFNEISFDDTKGSEGVTIHAQKDYNIKVGNNVGAQAAGNATSSVDGNSSNSVGGNNSMSISGDDSYAVTGNLSGTVGGNKSFTVSGNQELNVGGNETASVGGNQDATVGSNQTASVGSNQTISVGSNQEVSISSNQNISVGSNQTTSVGATQNISATTQNVSITGNATTSATEISLSGSSKIVLSVGGASITIESASITIAMGASSVKVDPSGVSVMGPIVKLN